MHKSPLIEESDLVSFSISSEGITIPDTYEIVSIKVKKHVNRISEAELILNDGAASTQKFEIADGKTFKPGKQIEIKLGYHGNDKTVFEGMVVKQIVKIDASSGPRLHIICKDKVLKMTVNRRSAIFSKKTDSTILKSLITDAGFSGQVSDTLVENETVVQYDVSDWDFMLNRAKINGMLVIPENDKVTSVQPDLTAEPVLGVTYGIDIIDFKGELDTTYQSLGMKGSASEKIHMSLLESRLSRFKGFVTFQGSAKAKVNSTINLAGLCEEINGNAFISGVIHTVEEGNWITKVKLGLSTQSFTKNQNRSLPKAAGLIPGLQGLQTGIVMKIFDDPENQYRVLVEVPILGNANESVWARLATFYASNNFGAFFMPEVGDEVVLGFMNEDPRFPVILGSVYSSKLQAPETPDENNSIKTLVTKSKMQLKFDEENKVITILTPEGNTMEFSEKDKAITITDQNKNKIEMNPDGVAIDSFGGISIKAQKEVIIEGASVKIKGDQSIVATAAQVDISATMSASLKGSAECKIASDGNLSAKGLMVMIN